MIIGHDLFSQRSLKVLILATVCGSSLKAITLDRTVIQSLDEIALNDAGGEND